LNEDLTQYAVEHTQAMDWTPSPSATVWRKRVYLAGDTEKGAVTSVVRYPPGSRFPAHDHPEGEEILVLDGVFEDDHGEYPAGTYLLNPAGYRHNPSSQPGCVIFVRLRQYGGAGRRSVRVDTRDQSLWEAHPEIAGAWRLPLYRDPDFPDSTHMLRIEANAPIPTVALPGGEEIFVVEGAFEDEHGAYRVGSWVRYPAGSRHTPATRTGCELLVRGGHLPRSR
jgi:anti-sigma factor ChrR (cupin superfamily)